MNRKLIFFFIISHTSLTISYSQKSKSKKTAQESNVVKQDTLDPLTAMTGASHINFLNKKKEPAPFLPWASDFGLTQKAKISHSSPETTEKKQQPNHAIQYSLDARTFLTGGSNVALLNSNNDFDQALFLQSIINFGLTIKTVDLPEHRKLEFHLTGRTNTVLGSPETTQIVTPDLIRIGHTVTEFEHTHAFDKPLFWVREAWMKIYSQSQNSLIQCGYFPKQIGLGLILGNKYRVGEPLLTNTSEEFVDQYRPGIKVTTKLKDSTSTVTGYVGIDKVHSTSIDQQMGMTKSQELQEMSTNRYIYKGKKPIQNSFIVSLEASTDLVQKTESNRFSLKVSPFILYKHDPNQTIEFFSDATSRLWTTGSSFDFEYKKFFGSIDVAVQAGFQQVKAWDRNTSIEEGTKKLTHLFSRADGAAAWETSSVFPTETDISLSYDSGATFKAISPIETVLPAFDNFKNAETRFRKSYRNSLTGILCAADCGYRYSDSITLGAILGIISGDENPNNTTEEAALYRLDSSWNSVRRDKNNSYSGFQGTDSLYSGKNVHSHYLLKSNRLANSITTEPELTPNSCTNLGYLGFGIKYERELRSSGKKWSFHPNIIFMIQTHRVPFGYDPTIFDTYSPATILPNNDLFASALKKMPRTLGMELNTNFEFYDSDHLSLYGSLSVFIPGSYYSGIKSASYNKQGKVIPLKNQLYAEKANLSGIETRAQNTVTLLNNASMTCYLGCSLSFDSIAEFFSRSKKSSRK